ncbi:MAG: hypothetical protein HGB29_07345 [Chlorobiaceae bacterium]|nr:hypothetical protein [Chlorobiaceae bacterium]NTW74661.1 hypothetical protein [Chlorobiaceae bacterium]
MQNKIHPDAVLDDVYEVIDEPNFNNFNTSPDPPSPYADLEKKYRKNKFNRARNSGTATPSLFGTHGLTQPGGTKASGNKVQKKKNRKAPTAKPSRSSNGKRTH